jgi:hypothetical protein
VEVVQIQPHPTLQALMVEMAALVKPIQSQEHRQDMLGVAGAEMLAAQMAAQPMAGEVEAQETAQLIVAAEDQANLLADRHLVQGALAL